MNIIVIYNSYQLCLCLKKSQFSKNYTIYIFYHNIYIYILNIPREFGNKNKNV